MMSKTTAELVQAVTLGKCDAGAGREALRYRVGESYVSAEPGHTGNPLLGAAYVAGYRGAIAYKYADPTEDARWVFEQGDLDDIRREDPSLIVVLA